MIAGTTIDHGRVIDELRRRFGGTWRYDRQTQTWVGPDKIAARWCSACVGGDDDTFRRELWLYGRGSPKLIRSGGPLVREW